MSNASKLTILLILSLMLVSCSNMGGINETEYGFLAPEHSLQPNDRYEVLWNISNISATESSSLPSIVGAPQKIIVQGMEKDSLPHVQVFALDSVDGSMIWKIDGQNWGHIITQDDVLYRGMGGNAAVQAFNIEDAKLLWSTRLPGAHSTSDMHISENRIYVNTNDDEFFVLDDKGKILDHSREGFRKFLEAEGVIYMEGDRSIKAVDSSTDQELWRVEVGEYHRNSPLFDNGTIFIRTDGTPASLYSIDQASGNVNWTVSQNALSNLCILGDEVYFTTQEGYLTALDRNSGQEISKVRFSPGIDPGELFRNYFIACDPTNHVLAISFGDNTQIMGMRVIHP